MCRRPRGLKQLTILENIMVLAYSLVLVYISLALGCIEPQFLNAQISLDLVSDIICYQSMHICN